MSLIKRTDWPGIWNSGLLSNFFDNDRMFDADWLRKQSVPAVNVKETDKGFEVEVAAPGLSKKDFNVTVDNGVLTISSEKQEEKEEKEKDYTRREFSYSSFSRSFTMPDNVNEDDIKASYGDGILKLTVSKRKPEPSNHKKAIEVK